MEGQNKTILLVCSEPESKEVIIHYFEDEGHKVIAAESKTEMQLKFSNQNFDMIVADLDIPNLSLLSFIEELRSTESMKGKRHIPLLIIGKNSRAFYKQFYHVDKCRFCEKPIIASIFSVEISEFFAKPTSSNAKAGKQIRAGDFLIKEGDQSHELYLVSSGHFIIYKKNQDGIDAKVGEAFAGEIIGEMSFLDDMPRSASVQAQEDSVVIPVATDRFYDVMAKQPKWLKSLIKVLSKRIRTSNEYIADRLNEDIHKDAV